MLTQDKVAKVFREFYASEIEPRFRKSDKVFECEMVTQKCREATIAAWKAGKTADEIIAAIRAAVPLFFERKRPKRPTVAAFKFHNRILTDMWFTHDGRVIPIRNWYTHAHVALTELHGDKAFEAYLAQRTEEKDARAKENNRPELVAFRYVIMQLGWIRTAAISYGESLVVQAAAKRVAPRAASTFLRWFVKQEANEYIVDFTDEGHVDIPMDTAGHIYDASQKSFVTSLMRNNVANPSVRAFNETERVETASVNDYILYHSTYPDRALTILEQGEFKFRPIVGTRSDQNVPNSYFLSLTRSKLNSFAVANSAHYYVMFNLNRRTIAKRFKIYPVSYWQDRGNVGKTQFNDEAEERITSNTPEGLKIPANAKELIDGVHILAEQKSINEKTYPKATERLLKLVRLCKAKRIPVFIYADKKSFLVQNKLRAKPLSYLLDAYKALRPEIRDAYVYRGSDRRKSYDGVRIHGLIQLFKVDKYSQLDKHAKKVWYDWVRRADPAYGHLTADVVRSLEAAIHNANSEPNSQIRKTIDALVAEMKKHGFKTLKEMLQGLNVKWSKILDAKDKAERESWEASKKLFDLDGYYGAWITDSGDYIGIVSKKGYINTVAQQFPNDAEIQKFADAKDHDGLSAFLMRKRGWIRLTLPRGHDEASGNEDVDTHSPDYHRRATIDMANNRASHKALETLERLFRSGGGGFKTTEINIDDKHFEFTWRNSDERKKLMRAQYNRKGIPEFKKNEETAQAEGQMPYGYWISPNGKIENVDFEKHWYLASAVIRSRLNAPSLYKEYPTEALQTAYGYARTINRYFATDRNSLSISIPKGGLTSTQASALASIFKDNGFDKAVVEIISEQPDAKGFEHDYARANSLYELNVVLRKNVAKKQITANVSHSWIDDDDGRFWLLHGGAVVWVGHPAQYDHEHRARELILRDHKKEFAAWRKSDKGREYYPYTAFAMRELGWIRMAADNAYDVAQKEIAKPAAMKLIRALSQRRDDPENPITYYVAVVDKNHPWGADTAVPTKKFTRREAMQQIAHNIKGAVAHASLDEITLRYIEGFHDFENEQIVRPLYFEKHKALFNTWDGFYRDKLEPFAKKYKLNKANRFKVLKRVRLAFMLGHREGEIPGALKAAGNVFEEILARYRGRKATPKGQLELFASDASIWDTNNNCFIDADGKIHWIDEDHMDFAADWIAKHPADKKEFEDQQYSSTVDYLLHRGWVRVRNTHRNAIEISKDRLSLKAYRTLVRQLRDTQEDTYLDVTYHEKNILRNVGGKFEPHEKSRLFSVLQNNVAKHEAKAASYAEEKYWIAPDGKKHTLKASDSHRTYISRVGLTVERAIKDGWVRARYDEYGDASLSFMFLNGALSGRAVNACIRLMAEIGTDLEFVNLDVVQRLPLDISNIRAAKLSRDKRHLAVELLQKARTQPSKGLEETAGSIGGYWIDENGKLIDLGHTMHLDYCVTRFKDDADFQAWFKKEYHYRDMEMAQPNTVKDATMGYAYRRLGWVRVIMMPSEIDFAMHKSFPTRAAVTMAARVLQRFRPADKTRERYLVDDLSGRTDEHFFSSTDKHETLQHLKTFPRVTAAIASYKTRTSMDMWITHEGRELPVGEDNTHTSVAYAALKNDDGFHPFYKAFTGEEFSENDPKRKLIARFYATNILGWVRCSALDQDNNSFNVDFKKDGIARRAANALLQIIKDDFPDGYHIDVLDVKHWGDRSSAIKASQFFKSFEGSKAAALVRENTKKNMAVAKLGLNIKLESNGIERGRNMQDGRYVLHMYSILIDGQKEAELAIKFVDGSKEYAKVNIFGAAQHKLGAAGVRQLLAIVKKKFPKLKHIYGDRISGARAKSGHSGERARMTIASTPTAFWIGEKIRSPYMVVLTVRTRGKLFRTPIGWNKRTFISGAFRRFLIYKYVGVITPRQLDLEIQNVMALIARQNGTRVDIRKARRAIQRTSLGFMGMGASIKVTAGAVNWDTGKPILRKFYDTRTLGNFPLTKKQCQSWGIIQGTPISTAPIQLKNITTFDAAIAPRDFSVMYRKFSNAFAQKIAQRYNSIVSRYESEALAKADMSRAIDMIVSKGGEAMCLDYLRDRFEEDLTFKRKLHKKEWRVIYRAMISYTRDRLSQLTPIKGVL